MVGKFEKEYFQTAYPKGYEKRNPRQKFLHYLNRIRDIRPSGHLLEIGCAYGIFLSEAKAYFDIAGCDISSYAVDVAKDLLPRENIFQSSLLDIPENTSYDIVSCFDVLEHIKELDEAFLKLRRLLSPNGILAFTVPVYDTLAGWLVGKLDRDETHVWKESRHFWREMVQKHSFELVMDEGLWRYSVLGIYYMFFGGRAVRNFSPALYLICQKKESE